MEPNDTDAVSEAGVQLVLLRWKRALEEPQRGDRERKQEQPCLLGHGRAVCFQKHECKCNVCNGHVELSYSRVLCGVEQNA